MFTWFKVCWNCLRLRSKNYETRKDAAYELGKMTDSFVSKFLAVGPLLRILNDKSNNNTARWFAIIALGKLKNSRAVEPLIEILLDKDNPDRCTAVQALGNLGDD